MSNEERFLRFVHKSKTCWLWAGYLNKDGYGKFRYKGHVRGAHRISWILFKTPIPNGLCVLHKCDNPKCVNPSHLFIGTQIDNIKDMVKKKRWRGPDQSAEKSHRAKLNWKSVKLIRQLKKEGHPVWAISNAFAISQANIYFILNNQTWVE